MTKSIITGDFVINLNQHMQKKLGYQSRLAKDLMHGIVEDHTTGN